MAEIKTSYDEVVAERIIGNVKRMPVEKESTLNWRAFTGKTLLHKRINAYLAKSFVDVGSPLPIDKCEAEANEVVQLCEMALNHAQRVSYIMTIVYYAMSAGVIGFWIGVSW